MRLIRTKEIKTHLDDRAKQCKGAVCRIVVGPLQLTALERLDGYVRLPVGVYSIEACYMRNRRARAYRYLPEGTMALQMGDKTREALEAGRLYAHGIDGDDRADQLEGCTGVPHFETWTVALGGWVEGQRHTIEILDE